MSVNDWDKKLQFSLNGQPFDTELLKEHITGCVSVRKTDVATDKTGIDYIAELKDGARLGIDAKTRMKGASSYWKYGVPELAVEIYSKYYREKEMRVIGWTLSERTGVDYILYTFDPADTDRYFFIPFQLLRLATIHNGHEWAERYGIKKQWSNNWTSTSIFVPAPAVLRAVCREMVGNI